MIFRKFAGLILAASMSLNANALIVSFTEPDGVVGPNDTIPVFVTVTADEAFDFDGNDPANSYGLDPASVPFEGRDRQSGEYYPFDQIFGVSLTPSFTCTGSFTAGGSSPCSDAADPYSFNFNNDDDGISGVIELSLAQGESATYRFGEFVPNGAVAAGTYNFYGANINVGFFGQGTDNNGNQVFLDELVTLASTCSSPDTSCDFSRTVVPVPAAAWMFGSALLALFGTRRA